uniref:Uncharacterized protein n=1 Tax=Brassica oleracea var. oleracea TaxID=109376 RepID=A0A0D3BNZ9_BRAOL
MGAQDVDRQALNVFRIRLLGAKVRGVHSETATLKNAISEAIRDWVTNVETTHYILGSVAGPHPYPMMVRDFHAVIGKETRRQALEKWGGKPDILVACVDGGSNTMRLFHEFVDDAEVRMIGVEVAGFGLDSGKHAAPLTKGDVGVLHGAMSYLLQDDDGHIIEPQFVAFSRVSRLEGIISALETSHALEHLEKLCPTLPDGARVVLNFRGRGDKDDQTVAKYLEV